MTEPDVTGKFRTESETGNKGGEKDDGGRCTRRFSGNDRWQRHSRTRWQLAAHAHQCAAEEQQTLDEKLVENQAEDEVESHVDGANKVQVQQTVHQIQVAEEQRVHDNGVEMRTTKQVGDEDIFESREVSA